MIPPKRTPHRPRWQAHDGGRNPRPASAPPAAVSETSAANRLVDPLCHVNPLCHEGTGEAHHKEGHDCYRDQVNRPRVALSADKIEMSGMAFVPIGVKAHDSGLPLGGLLNHTKNSAPPHIRHAIA